MSQSVYIIDNLGKTYDRYTVITEEGDMFTMSHNPFYPTGFNLYAFNLFELPNLPYKTIRLMLSKYYI
jgi:hypothetical protein